jgi:hypothetical protein
MDERETRRRCRTRARSGGLGLLLGGLVACGGGQGTDGRDGRDHPDPSKAPEAPAETAVDAVRWRFVPTLEQHLPAGAVGETVLELSHPRQRTVVILAAVLRAGAEHVELERWTFAQSPDGQSLQLVNGGEPMVRLRPGTRSPALGDFRRELAVSRVVLTRPMGLPAADPRALLDTLATAFTTVRDAKAEPKARVKAAAVVVQGLDDTVIFERDASWEVAEILMSMPAEVEVEVLAERRARASLAHAGGTATLELQRKSDGWAISAVERPEPPAVAPSETGATTSGRG